MVEIKSILDEITRLRLQRGWSEYELATQADIPQSTISTWYRKNQQPTIASLEKICKGFGITLSQFFAEEGAKVIPLTSKQKAMLDSWSLLPERQQELLLEFLGSKARTHSMKE